MGLTTRDFIFCGFSIGLLYCDVMGLKRANDTKGHGAGDELLIRASECLKREFSEYHLFRVGGDEFLVLCEGIEEEELLKRVELVRKDMKKSDALMALGVVWRAESTESPDALIAEADNRMYEEKMEWYMKKENIT